MLINIYSTAEVHVTVITVVGMILQLMLTDLIVLYYSKTLHCNQYTMLP